MALQMVTTDSPVGFTFPASYCKINSITADKEVSILNMAWFADEQARIDGKNPIKVNVYQMVNAAPGQSATYAEGYTYLKTLPEFVGAVDV